MAETPTDILRKHVERILAAKWLPDGAPNSTELANEIERELRQNFQISSYMDPAPASNLPEGTVEITIRVSGNPTLWYMGTDLRAYRLDEGFLPNSQGFPSGREAQIALALTDLGASRLREVVK